MIDPRQEARSALKGWATDPNTRYLGIATTDLHGVPVEVVVLGADGRTLLRSYVATDQPISPDASRVHGVETGMLRGAPALADVVTKMRPVLGRGPVIAFAAPWLGARFAQAGVRVGLTALGAQDRLSAALGTYREDTGDFAKVSLRELVQATGQDVSRLAPLGSALGNTQRLTLVVRHFGLGGQAVSDEQPDAEESCPDCGAPVHFCECAAPSWSQPRLGAA